MACRQTVRLSVGQKYGSIFSLTTNAFVIPHNGLYCYYCFNVLDVAVTCLLYLSFCSGVPQTIVFFFSSKSLIGT